MGIILAILGILVLFFIKGGSHLLDANYQNSVEHMQKVEEEMRLDGEANNKLLQMYNDHKKRIPLIETVADDLYEIWGDDWLDEHLPYQTNTTKVLPSILFFVVSKKGKLLFNDTINGWRNNKIYDKLTACYTTKGACRKNPPFASNVMSVKYIKDKDEADLAFKAWGKIDENLRKFHPNDGIVMVNGAYNGAFLSTTWRNHDSIFECPVSSADAKRHWKYAQDNYPYVKELKIQNDEEDFFKMFPEFKDV